MQKGKGIIWILRQEIWNKHSIVKLMGPIYFYLWLQKEASELF